MNETSLARILLATACPGSAILWAGNFKRKILPGFWEKREMDDDQGKGFEETERGVDVPWTSMRRIKSMRRKGPKKECTPPCTLFYLRPLLEGEGGYL
jgi:hypothetical protein